MKVALIDPSLFTIPYDDALGEALAAAGCTPRLYGRRLRNGESHGTALPYEPFFYRLSERFHGRLPTPLLRLAKGAEHAGDMLRLRRRLTAERPDLIHFQWTPLPIVDSRILPGFRALAPTLLTVHDPTPFNGSARGAVQAIGAAAIYDAFDHLIVHTAGGRAHLIDGGIDESKISVIPHGPLRLPAAREGAATAAASDAVSILLFGKIKHYKGLDLLIEAFATLPEELQRRARLRIVGEPHLPLEPLLERARVLGIAERIDWEPRFIDDAEIPGLLASAGILAFPYRQIDASGVLMAALGHGKPILASRLGAFAEMLRDGVHGRLVPPEDVAALAEGLAFLLEDPVRAKAMGDNVRALASEITGWDEIAARTTALYRRLVASRAIAQARRGRASVSRSAGVLDLPSPARFRRGQLRP
jgi:glycosyltransferase involved in cell wall biosynthesis